MARGRPKKKKGRFSRFESYRMLRKSAIWHTIYIVQRQQVPKYRPLSGRSWVFREVADFCGELFWSPCCASSVGLKARTCRPRFPHGSRARAVHVDGLTGHSSHSFSCSPTGDPEGVGAIVNQTGDLEAYPIGAMQYEALRKRAQAGLGPRFDSREYHQMLLSDGPLPFWALGEKVDRWISAQR
jgi:hypothetical protein